MVDVDRRVSEVTGLRPGDVLLSVNRRRIESAEQAARLLGDPGGRGYVLVHFSRGGELVRTTFRVR